MHPALSEEVEEAAAPPRPPPGLSLVAVNAAVLATGWADGRVLWLNWRRTTSAGGFACGRQAEATTREAFSPGRPGTAPKGPGGGFGGSSASSDHAVCSMVRAPDGAGYRACFQAGGDEEIFAMGLRNGSLGIWQTGDVSPKLYDAHSRPPAVDFMWGERCVTCAADGFVRVWDVNARRCLSSSFALDRLAGTRSRPTGFVPVVKCFRSVRGKKFLATVQGAAELWTVDQGGYAEPQLPIPCGEVVAAAVDGGGPFFATAGSCVRLWDMRKLAEAVAEDPRPATAITFAEAPGTARCVAAAGPGGVRLLEASGPMGLETICWADESFAEGDSAPGPDEEYVAIEAAPPLPLGSVAHGAREVTIDQREQVLYAMTRHRVMVLGLWGLGPEGTSLRVHRRVDVRRTEVPSLRGPDSRPLPRESHYAWGPEEARHRRLTSDAASAKAQLDLRGAPAPGMEGWVRLRGELRAVPLGMSPQALLIRAGVPVGELPALSALERTQAKLRADAEAATLKLAALAPRPPAALLGRVGALKPLQLEPSLVHGQ